MPELSCTDQEYCDAMTMSGTKVEAEAWTKSGKIVVGQIEKIEKHPDADKLIVCQVNIGAETIQIVTGAPNVKEGDKVPAWVLTAVRVAGGMTAACSRGGHSIKAGVAEGSSLQWYDVLY